MKQKDFENHLIPDLKYIQEKVHLITMTLSDPDLDDTFDNAHDGVDLRIRMAKSLDRAADELSWAIVQWDSVSRQISTKRKIK